MKTALQIGLTALLAGALAFYGGVMYGKAVGGGPFRGVPGGRNVMTFRNGPGGGGANADANAVRMRGGLVNGEVISADGKSITVKSTGGSTRTVYLDPKTRVTRSEEATLTDLKKGAIVVVAGSSGDDGAITARSVQIVPEGADPSFFFGAGARVPGGRPPGF